MPTIVSAAGSLLKAQFLFLVRVDKRRSERLMEKREYMTASARIKFGARSAGPELGTTPPRRSKRAGH
jgi:hypothetical protein